MKSKQYGEQPTIVGKHHIKYKEMMCFLYLPIKMKNNDAVKIPQPILNNYGNIINHCITDFKSIKQDEYNDYYIYVTAKNLFVTPDNIGNRPGWHSDGFGTEDINYIWMDKYPTIFSIKDFKLSENHEVSMKQMEEQATEESEQDYGENTLLRLDKYNIHRAPDISESGIRQFLKISFSKYKYNLIGNSHNYEIDYDWEMYSREEIRNHPIYKEKDFYIEEEIK